MKRFFGTLFTRVILLILTASVLLGSLAALSSCGSSDPAKQDIADRIASSEPGSYGYVMQYYKLWDMPKFDSTKMAWTEDTFQSNYNYGQGLPDTYEHAKLAASFFLDNYYDRIDLDDKKEVTDALIAAYVNTVGDPYAVYRVADEFDDYSNDINGSFGGIGVVVEYNHQNATIMVSSVNIGSPAESAGFMPGDFIVAVDGVSVDKLGYLNAVYYIRGEIGTSVTVTVMRGSERLDLTCTRAKVEETSVAYELMGEYGYILVTDFKANTTAQFIEAIDYMKSQQVRGIIFDVRNNPGGLVSTVCDMISYLIPNGHTIISYDLKGTGNDITLKSENNTHPQTSESKDYTLDLPIAIICNEYSASSAEIFTSAIRDYRNAGLIDAVIVGKTTYKKGIMQSTFPHYDGSAITFTIAYYNPPSGVNYHGIGITPDHIVDNTDTEDLQLSKALYELELLSNEN